MPLLSTLSYSALSSIGGWCLGTQISARQQRNDARSFQDEILAEIDERYDAYTELEGRITRAIAQFDHEEARAAREVAQKEQRIQELEACLERTIDHAHAEGGALTQLEAALGNFLHDVGAAPVEDALGRRNLEQEMQELRGGLARSQSAKDAQIQQQETTIGQLAASVAHFEAEQGGSATAMAVQTSVADEVLDAFDAMGDDAHSAQREELTALRERVAALSPYVEQLATADDRIQQLESTCDELREDHVATTSLHQQVAELEASGRAQEKAAQAAASESDHDRRELEQARGRVAQLERQQGDVNQGRMDQVQTLEARVVELEASGRENEDAVRTAETQGEALRAQLEQRVAELSPLTAELDDARARVQELESRCTQMDEARVDETGSVQDAQRALAQVQGELLANQNELAESEKLATKLERRCDSIRSKKDEQLDALRSRVADLETVHDELGQKSELLDEMEERCSALERSKKRAASTTRRLREELAEAEDVVREAGGDPKALRRERAERQKQLLELFDGLDEVALGMKSQEERVDRLDGAYNEALCDQECELDRLEERVRDLYLFMEAAGDVIAQLESKA